MSLVGFDLHEVIGRTSKASVWEHTYAHSAFHTQDMNYDSSIRSGFNIVTGFQTGCCNNKLSSSAHAISGALRENGVNRPLTPIRHQATQEKSIEKFPRPPHSSLLFITPRSKNRIRSSRTRRTSTLRTGDSFCSCFLQEHLRFGRKSPDICSHLFLFSFPSVREREEMIQQHSPKAPP